MNTSWSKPTKYIVSIGLVLFGLYLFYLISRSVLTLLVLAGLIAFLVRPIIRFLHHRLRFPRGLAVLLTYLLVLVVIALAPLFLVPAIADAINFVAGINYPVIIQNGLQWVQTNLENVQAWDMPFEPLDNYVDGAIAAVLNSLQDAAPEITPDPPSVSQIFSRLTSAVTVTFGVAAGVVGSVFSSIVLFIFMLLSSIYMSMSSHRFRDSFMNLVPPLYKSEVATLLERLGYIWVAFFRGQFTLMIIIGVVTWLGLMALGVPGALSLAIVAGLMEIIPNLGPIIAAIPAVLVALLQGPTYFEMNHLIFALIVILFYWVIQNLENSIIVPKVLGEAVELPPLIVMSGVFVGASVGGILGALLATPVIASGKEVVQYAYRKILDEPPFPAEDQPKPRRESSPSEGLAQRIGRLRHALRRRFSSPTASQTTTTRTED